MLVPASLLETGISGLEYDSRRVAPGYLFFAFQGAHADGRCFAGQAEAQGAVAVVSEEEAPADFRGTWIRVEHGRRTLALMARKLYADAASHVMITGATGTNGKTTACTLVDQLLNSTGNITALAGTIEYRVAGKVLPAVNTTPESVDLYRLFEELRQAGGCHATMEVSSHALALGRVHGMRFHTALFTNLTRDHLDFHPDMQAYFEAKCGLFAGQDAPPPRFAILNRDDEWASRIPLAAETEVSWYGVGEGADLRASSVQTTLDGLRFRLHWKGSEWPASSPLAGHMNVYNLLAAFGVGLTYGLEAEAMIDAMSRIGSVPGRFERVNQHQPFLVVVDYAHTDDALRNTLRAARQLGAGRVLTVFGCGGDRDRAKRPLMGQAAGELSDFVVVTSDNPRSEEPLDIINDALVGLRRTDVNHCAEPDRAKAIRIALERAGPGDVVLIAGKGHETYQVLRQGVIHFDDREVSRQILMELGYGKESER
ncbi:MAG: UDP-N-acetylmuramoyl-L-alanyl-D-glutamate--2,6-diaminopimelate ligase [Acidobacteriia bacterium]|nr:UDP-N-acetylmuramoyl-L-alanyl-D-glutamate--2,6-diaminopimelate ligase [Terriglobia bacterium]